MSFLQPFYDEAISQHFLDPEISRGCRRCRIGRNGGPLGTAKMHTGCAISVPPYHVNCLPNIQVDIRIGVGRQRCGIFTSAPVPCSHRTAAYCRSNQHLTNHRKTQICGQCTCSESHRQHEQIKSACHQLNRYCAACQQPPDSGFIHGFSLFRCWPLFSGT